MTCAQLTHAQIITLKAARGLSPDDRKEVKKELFALIKEKFGIPADHKLTVEIDDQLSTFYGVIKDKTTRQPFLLAEDGKWVHAERQMTVPSAQPKRWFMVSADDAKQALADYLAQDGVDFEDGDTGLEMMQFQYESNCLAVDQDGDFWVQLTEDELI